MVRSSLLVALLGLALGACGARSSHAIAWPKTAAAETDGGESLAPHQAAATTVADDTDDVEDTDEPAVTVMPTTVIPATTTPTTTAPTTTPPTEETITVEEITIEIDD